MSETAVTDLIETLTRTVERLVERVEDLEDNRDLGQAIAENSGKPLVSWDKAKALLDLDLATSAHHFFLAAESAV